MPEDFFSESGTKEKGRDPREYPDEWVFGKQGGPPPGPTGRRPPHVGAVLLILAGVVFFLNNTGIVHIGSIFAYWPLILIAVGMSKLACSRGLSQLWAIMVVSIGALFLAHAFRFFSGFGGSALGRC